VFVVRLIGPTPRDGRVEILRNDTWGSVCTYNFGNDDARVVCYMLGFGYDIHDC